MLVFTRSPGESFYIGESKVTVLENRSGRIRIGIDAPDDIPVLRSELLDEHLQRGAAMRDPLGLADRLQSILHGDDRRKALSMK